ncbi:DUF4097 family beta strand repeat-containing protein [Flavitalea sp. BT771]|uniref:DUF4097 family beta strand repeat-containing protein n=1 Tax=Flavitalea sp. BT771 TaxID=3063329 RepID=UPI0026E27FE5|nr:DUF4097 family beta strand repeat-containing protein [Flavitalea sp. BT771]MDO6435000.1 DUF4097 family beta strand repeat-containing protein [Flavitalea sp. BT771]MDV6223900.1 DUF4097 family beta strand repeat-containing protein [Flavitalea sp. BT771]
MKKLSLLILSGLQILAVAAQSPSGGTRPYLQKSLAGLSIREVTAETSGGNIYVSGVPDAEARVEVYVRGNHGEELSGEDARRRLEEQFDLTVSTDDHKVRAIARPKRNINWNKSLSISFKIYAPESVTTILRTSGGNISLKKLSGSTQDFRTSGGNLDIDQLTGRITGKTSGGNVNISDSKSEIDLVTSGGNIEATHCEGNLHLGTSGGDLKLRLLKGTIRATTSGGTVRGEEIDGELHASTSGGNIRLTDLTCSLSASTSGGDINVSLKEMGKFLDLTNSSGNVSLQLPQGKGMDLRISGDKVRVNTLTNFKGESDEKHIDGAMNGGGIPVKVSNSSGDVTLTFK